MITKNGKEMQRVWLTDGDGKDNDIDARTGALSDIDLEHRKIHDSKHYFIEDFVSLGNGTSRQFIFVTPATPIIHLTYEIEFALGSLIELTEGVTTDADGTTVTAYNNDRNSANTTSMNIYHTPTNPTGGTIIARAQKGDNARSGGLVRSEREKILKSSTKYMLEITNNGASGSLTNWLFNFYEQ